MPRFLNTWTGEFEWHPDPNKVTYAILSHVWRDSENGGEQSYDDVLKIQAAVRKGRFTPFRASKASLTEYRERGTIFARPELSDKIKGFCKVAREAGFRLAWNDACCIDKTSSAELSEAINSMYEWYRLSDMCYVYLADVSDGDVPTDSSSSFRRSGWHYRGWTLQELIAPERIIFLTRTWNVLGTKIGLAKTLEEITKVDFDILVGRTTLDSVSVARRMSWAAKRQTTRVEDRAYSLFGIFGLHMSPIYGEGENAFLRLQEEIIRTIPDQSILVWGNKCDLELSDKGEWSVENCYGSLEKNVGLLASYLTSFSGCSDIEPIASSPLAEILDIKEGDVPPVHCIFTPEGVSMRLICLPLSGVPDIRKAFQAPQSARDICAGCGEFSEVDTVALLQCQERPETGATSIRGLPLSRSRRAGDGSNQRAFHIGSHIHDGSYSRFYHTVRLPIRVLMKVLKHVRPTVKDVTLLRHYSGPLVPKSLQWSSALGRFHRGFSFKVSSYLKDAVYEFSPHSTDALRTLGIDPSPLQVTHLEQEIILETTLAFHRDSGAGPTDGIALRLSITKILGYEAEANFSVGRVGVVGLGSGQSSIGAAAGASHRAVVPTPHISGGFLDLDHRNDSRTVIPFYAGDMYRRTILHIEYTVQSEGMWGSWARLLRIALQNTFASLPDEDDLPRPNLWVSIDLSEEFSYESSTESGLDSPSSDQTDTNFCECDSETSNGHDNLFPSCESSPLPVFADQQHAVYASRDDFEALKEATWGTSSERSDNTALASAIALPGCGQAGPSDVPAEPQLGQKRPRKTSPGAESLGGSNAKRICQGFLLAEDSSPQEHSNPRIPGSKTGQSCNDAGHEGRRDGSGTTADWTWSGNAGDEVAIVSEQDQNIQSSGESEDSSTRRAVTTLPGLAKLDSVAREAEFARSENTIHAVRDTVETLRRENDALRTQTSAMGAQIAGLEATNAKTRAEISELRAQMAQMLSLLNTPAASQGSNGTRDGLL